MITARVLAEEARALLVGARNNEVRRRTVIGRAYYAAYHHLRDLAVDNGFALRRDGGGVHEQLIAWLAEHPKPEFRYAGSLLRTLRLARRIADYQIKMPVAYQQATDAVERAEELLAEYGEDD